MKVSRTTDELRTALNELRAEHGSVALAPTMGALHAGHESLLARARQDGGAVVASVFVNPTQFDARDDFARYPRDEARDFDVLRGCGCDLVWAPDGATMYPAADATSVSVGGPAEGWEDAHRPGHFRGVATVVAKLFGQVRPDAAVFGEKDWQQLQVVRRMAADLHLGVRVIGAPTVREQDGLALSSRNGFLTAPQRAAAPLLHATLAALAAALGQGGAAERPLAEAGRTLAERGFAVDYLALVEGETLRELPRVQEGARLIAAARLGSVRLLDNVAAQPHEAAWVGSAPAS